MSRTRYPAACACSSLMVINAVTIRSPVAHGGAWQGEVRWGVARRGGAWWGLA